VIYDDVALPTGKLRIRERGSAGGQNGVKSIILNANTDEFPRIRIGVGDKAHPDMDLADHVLSKFSKAEQKVMFEALGDVYEAVKLIVAGDIQAAMNRFN